MLLSACIACNGVLRTAFRGGGPAGHPEERARRRGGPARGSQRPHRVVGGRYEPRVADATVLHHVVRTHLEPFLAAAAAATDGAGVPRFVEAEFRAFLGCGLLTRGFARVRCDGCAFERLVPFSCKGRFCPSCCGRRMAAQAAQLVDRVLPAVPVRQWVLTVPHRLRYRLAFDHGLARAVLRVFVRALLALYRRRARRAGVADGHGGTVTVIQRFG